MDILTLGVVSREGLALLQHRQGLPGVLPCALDGVWRSRRRPQRHQGRYLGCGQRQFGGGGAHAVGDEVGGGGARVLQGEASVLGVAKLLQQVAAALC